MTTEAEKVTELKRKIFLHNEEIRNLREDIEKIQDGCSHPEESIRKAQVPEDNFTFTVVCLDCDKAMKLKKCEKCSVCLGEMQLVDEVKHYADGVSENSYKCVKCGAEYKEIDRI